MIKRESNKHEIINSFYILDHKTFNISIIFIILFFLIYNNLYRNNVFLKYVENVYFIINMEKGSKKKKRKNNALKSMYKTTAIGRFDWCVLVYHEEIKYIYLFIYYMLTIIIIHLIIYSLSYGLLLLMFS